MRGRILSSAAEFFRRTGQKFLPRVGNNAVLADPHLLMRIPDPAFYVNADPDADPKFQDPGFYWPKIKKNYSWKKYLLL